MKYEGNLITPSELIEGKEFLSPDGITRSQIPQIGWDIVDPIIDIKTKKIKNLKDSFLEIWNGYDLYTQITNQNIKDAILIYIDNWDLDSLKALASSQYVPDGLKIFQQQLAQLLPT